MWNIIIAILIITISMVLGTIVYFNHAFTYWSKKGVLYIKPTIPFGNIGLNFLKQSSHVLTKMYNDMKESGALCCGFYIAAKPILLPLDPKLYQLILVTEFPRFHDRGVYVNEDDPMDCNIANMEGKSWSNIRKKLSPTFTLDKIKSMLPIVLECSRNLEKILEDCNKNEKQLDIYDIAGRFTTDVIASIAFGFEVNCLQDPNHEFRKYGKKAISSKLRIGLSVCIPSLMKLLKIKIFDPKAANYFYQIVKNCIEYRLKHKIVRRDFIDLLTKHLQNDFIKEQFVASSGNKEKFKQNLDNDDSLTIEQIASQAFLFYLAAFETTSIVFSFLFYELAQNFNIQQKIKNEILTVLKKHNGEITYEGLLEMQYTEKVIYETMRKYPPVNMLNRICTQNFQIPGTDIIIEKGITVIIPVMAIHKDPEYYPNPEEFDPERFTEENKFKRPSFTYFPFGDGPRNCIGSKLALMEIKIGIIAFLKNYKYSLHPKTSVPIGTYALGNLTKSTSTIYLAVEKL